MTVAINRTRQGFVTFATLLLATASLPILLLLHQQIIGLSLRAVSQLATAVSVLALVAVGRIATHRLYSAGFLYLLVLCLFHLGLTWLYGLGLPFGKRYGAYEATWFIDMPYLREAIYLSILAVAAFVVAYLWTVTLSVGRSQERSPQLDTQPLLRVGATLALAGILLFVGDILATDSAIFGGGQYNEFNALVGGTGPVALGLIFVALGGPMVAASPAGPLRTFTLWSLAGFGALTLMIGSRTAFMYAAVGIVVAAARVHRMPRTRNAVIGILIGLVAMGIVGQLRGGPSTDATAVAVSPVPAITEMGGSLRPVEETVLWRQGDHEHEYHGITYVAGALRIYERLAGLPRPQADQRFAQTLMNERVPGLNLGYSSVAEAYLNFGIPGVVVIFLATGLLLGAMERRVFSSPYLAAALGAVTFVLAYEVRQSANIMLTLFAGVAVLTLFVRFLGRPKTARKHTYQLLAR